MSVEVFDTGDGLILTVTDDANKILETWNSEAIELLQEKLADPATWVRQCEAQTYPQTLESPAEYCDDTSQPGSHFCRRHTPEEEIM